MFIKEPIDVEFLQPVNTWDEFRQRWDGLHNFLLGGELIAPFDYEAPPLARIVEEVRADELSIVRSGRKAAAFDLTGIKPEFCRLPVHDALQSRFVLAHFDVHPRLSGKGQVFEGIEERWVEPWRRRLLE